MLQGGTLVRHRVRGLQGGRRHRTVGRRRRRLPARARSIGPSGSLRAVAAFLLVAAVPLTDEIGFVACAAFLAWHLYRVKRQTTALRAPDAPGPRPGSVWTPSAFWSPASCARRVPGPEFTLAWQHSVEKVRWEERYRVDGRPPAARRGTGRRFGRRHGAAARTPCGNGVDGRGTRGARSRSCVSPIPTFAPRLPAVLEGRVPRSRRALVGPIGPRARSSSFGRARSRGRAEHRDQAAPL